MKAAASEVKGWACRRNEEHPCARMGMHISVFCCMLPQLLHAMPRRVGAPQPRDQYQERQQPGRQ